MPRTFSPSLKANLILTSGQENQILLMEIKNQLLTNPIRVARSSVDIRSQGFDYTAVWFEATIPDDQQEEMPRARLQIDNIGRSITRWLEQLQGAPKTTARFILIQESDPDFHELDIELDLMNFSVTRQSITANMGYNDTTNQQAVTVQYRPINSPGLF